MTVELTRSGYARPVAVALMGLDTAGITADPLTIDRTGSTGTLSIHASATASPGTFSAGPGNVGLETTEVNEPATNTWTPGPLLHPSWVDATATRLANGKVLVFGGQDPAGFPEGATLLFE